MDHRCFNRPCCLSVANKLAAGQDMWFCVSAATTVSVRKGNSLSDGNKEGEFLVTITNRSNQHRTNILCLDPYTAQETCLRHLCSCPYLVADNLCHHGALDMFNEASYKACMNWERA